MTKPLSWRATILGDNGILLLLALLRLAPLLLTTSDLGWHRDELDMLDNAGSLAWGYIAYPPVAPFIARLALTLFGPSLIGVRLLPALAGAAVMILAGLMAREMGGKRWAQATAAVAVAIAPYAMLGGSLFSYSSFDFLWWALIAYLVVRLLTSDDARWWLPIGGVIGVGMMTKYTMAYLVAGVVVGVLMTRARRYLLSKWLWGGVALAVLIVLPNLIWQAQHSFISLDFLRTIHARDVRIGRTASFVSEQFYLVTNVVTVPVWLAGLCFYVFPQAGRPFRMLGWMFAVPLALLLATQGRPYYLAAAYPWLFAGGAVLIERWLASLPAWPARLVQAVAWTGFAISGLLFSVIAMPITPISSPLWKTVSEINGELTEMVGWPELVETVAGIYAALPVEERVQTGILTGNYGEAGAINLYGPAHGLPQAISGMNSYWLRGYGDPPPQTVIVLGLWPAQVNSLFSSCRTAGHISNRYGVMNEESEDHPTIFLCRGPSHSWTEIWQILKNFG